jgi:hypothetical protein
MGRTIVERLLHNVDDKIVTMRRVCIAQRARGNLKGGTDLHHLRKRTAARRIPRSWPVETPIQLDCCYASRWRGSHR